MILPVLSGFSALLKYLLSFGGIWVQRVVEQGQFQAQMETGILSQAAPQFCILRGTARSIGAKLVVLHVFTGMSVLLGDQLSPGGTWVCRAVAQGQL